MRRGFTVIELSIVLVVVGLIAGGVLVGGELVKAAEVRATITQIERYNTAKNAFLNKYGGLPGDIAAPLVVQFGFTAAAGRAGTAGLGDGNGIVDGYDFQGLTVWSVAHTAGEQEWFWEDLSTNSGLIEGGFSAGTATASYPGSISPTGAMLDAILPEANLGAGNYLTINETAGINYFTLSGITTIGIYSGGTSASPGITVQQAYAIDKKLDDGFPQTGNVVAKYANRSLTVSQLSWAAGGGVAGASPGTAASPSTASCYDNGGNAASPMVYSVMQNNGTGVNCALSFRFQ